MDMPTAHSDSSHLCFGQILSIDLALRGAGSGSTASSKIAVLDSRRASVFCVDIFDPFMIQIGSKLYRDATRVIVVPVCQKRPRGPEKKAKTKTGG